MKIKITSDIPVKDAPPVGCLQDQGTEPAEIIQAFRQYGAAA